MSKHEPNSSCGNPYAAPAIEPLRDDSILPPGTDYLVAEGLLYCRNNVNLSDVCWLTGGQTAQHRCKKFKSRLHSGKSPVTSVLICALAALTLFLWVNGVRTLFSKSIHVITLVLICVQSFGGTRPTIFNLKLGRSKKAIAAETSARRFLWGQIPIHIGFTIWAMDFEKLRYELVMAVWAAAWLSLAYWWLPKRFKAVVRKGEGNYFVVSYLEPEFLISVQRRIESRVTQSTSTSSRQHVQSID